MSDLSFPIDFGDANQRVLLLQATDITTANSTSPQSVWSLSVPGALLGNNGYLEVYEHFTTTSNANQKVVVYSLGGSDGTVGYTFTSTAAGRVIHRFHNAGSQSSQRIYNYIQNGGAVASGYGLSGTSAVATTGALTLTCTLTKATGTDTVTSVIRQVRAVYMP